MNHVDDKKDKNVESEQNLGKNEPPVKSEEESLGVFLGSAAEDSKLDAKLAEPMDLEEALVMKEDGTFEWKTCAYMTTRKRNMINHNIHQASTNAKVRDARLRRR